jgi:hypothetical protein
MRERSIFDAEATLVNEKFAHVTTNDEPSLFARSDARRAAPSQWTNRLTDYCWTIASRHNRGIFKPLANGCQRTWRDTMAAAAKKAAKKTAKKKAKKKR